MNKDVLTSSSRDPLFGFTEGECLAYLRETLQGRVINAYIFGSFGTAKFNKQSDIDVLIVCETEREFPDRGLDFSDLRERLPSLEILVYTPEEFAALTRDPTLGFWQSITASKRQIV